MDLEIRNNRIVQKVYTSEDSFHYETLLEVNSSAVKGSLYLFMSSLLDRIKS